MRGRMPGGALLQLTRRPRRFATERCVRPHLLVWRQAAVRYTRVAIRSQAVRPDRRLPERHDRELPLCPSRWPPSDRRYHMRFGAGESSPSGGTSIRPPCLRLPGVFRNAGIRAFEITLNTLQVIVDLARRFAPDEILIGAGTVLDLDQALAAVDAGACFVVMPHMDPEIVEGRGLAHRPFGNAARGQSGDRFEIG
ncbi:MAG: hypothetical protein ACHQ01_03125 [Candidatus Limnocylindrales bacterium]